MSLHSTGRGVLLFLAGTIALAAQTQAQDTDLVEKSPFLPPGFNRPEDLPSTAPTDAETVAPSNLRLNGVFSLAGVYRFNLFDTTTGKGIWVAENDTPPGYRLFALDTERSVTRFEGYCREKSQIDLAGSRERIESFFETCSFDGWRRYLLQCNRE